MQTSSSYPRKNWEKHAEQYFFNKERISSIDQKKKMMSQMKQKYLRQIKRMEE